jgi:L-ribulose-5-phosphate 3-epimerase
MHRRAFLQSIAAAVMAVSRSAKAFALQRHAAATSSAPTAARAAATVSSASVEDGARRLQPSEGDEEARRLQPSDRRDQNPAEPVAIRKAVLISMLPKDPSYAQRFAIAREAGFGAVEMQTIASPQEASEIKEAAAAAGVRIHSVMNADHWRFPLSSADSTVVDRSVAGMETSLRNAKLWGADAVLLVPAVVDAATSYRDAWTRSQEVIRKRLLPLAQELRIVIAIEEVWNKFLLSPLEHARYVDEFGSPWVKAYFDVGNIVFYGFPQDWIRTLGPRIAKVHLKDFQLDRPNGRFTWRNLGEGDIDWLEVHKAFAEISYRGYVTTEVAAGDAAYLKDLAGRVDRFLSGRKPI